MKSPFAGMDPFLEPYWLDVHNRLVTYASDWLNERLPADLVASTEERVAIDTEGDAVHRVGPDVRVFSPGGSEPADSGSDVIQAPFKLVVDLDPVLERFVRILDSGGQLITVVEFLSPSNKRGEGMAQYRTKREELLSGGVHVVEVDLVRAGNWRALLQPARLQAEAVTPYRTIVRMGRRPLGGYVFPIGFDRAAADVPVPLREGDGGISLPVQQLIDQAYERGRYGRRVDYKLPVDPALSPAEAEVVDRALKSVRNA